jgi:hypothetical protein
MYRIHCEDGEVRTIAPCGGGRKFVVVTASTRKGSKPSSLVPGQRLLLLALHQAVEVLSRDGDEIDVDEDGTVSLLQQPRGLLGLLKAHVLQVVPASCPAVGQMGWNFSEGEGGHLVTSVITEVERLP